jgi:hypothetical protein
MGRARLFRLGRRLIHGFVGVIHKFICENL